MYKKNLYNFLHFGYTFNNKNLNFPWDFNIEEEIKKYPDYSKYSYDQLVNKGIKIFKDIFKDLCKNSSSPHLIPLSGGLDSRFILGELMENYSNSDIQTISYGSPCTLDYEIPKKITKKFNIKHQNIDVSGKNFIWEEEKLISFIKQKNKPIPIFDSYINNLIPNTFGKQYAYWSGLLGGQLMGHDVNKYKNNNWKIAINNFVNRSKYSEINLLPRNKIKEIKNKLPQSPIINKNILSYEEQLNFITRQNSYVKPVVMNNDYNFKAPFLHPLIVCFMLSVPNKYRENLCLYKDILKKAHPKLFSMPIKTTWNTSLFDNKINYFLQRNKIRFINATYNILKHEIITPPMLNYSNFNEDLRKESSLRMLVYKNIKDLKNRNIVNWINIDGIWQNHQSRKLNLHKTLMLLASLELNIKAGNIK